MPNETCSTAICQCSMGDSTTTFNGSPFNLVETESKPAGTINDHMLGLNFPKAASTFGKCKSLANPVVLAATIANGGVLDPQPCVPVIPAPWIIGSPTVLISNFPALNSESQLLCTWAGTISISMPGEFTVMVP